MTLRVRILGAAAGGGLPQWNCGCENCVAARRGEIAPQTQSSICVSNDGETWALLNASPDLRQQFLDAPVLHPTALRRSPLSAVLLTNGDIDHVGGLLTLREKQPFTLFTTPEIHTMLADNPMFQALDPNCVSRRPVRLDESFEFCPGVRATLFAVPGKVPLYLEGASVETGLEGEQTVGVTLASDTARVHYVPGCARMTRALAERLTGADMVLFDGTLFEDDEMLRLGLGEKTGARMGHMSMNGPEGSLVAFADLEIARKVFVHMNNSNPVLDPRRPERAAIEAAGWTVGADGMEFSL